MTLFSNLKVFVFFLFVKDARFLIAQNTQNEYIHLHITRIRHEFPHISFDFLYLDLVFQETEKDFIIMLFFPRAFYSRQSTSDPAS